jgi:glutathione S-transferase
MKLYDMRSGLNPRRVRIFLAEKGLELPKVEVDMVKGDNRTAEFLALNPLGTLPVLELDDGTVLTESIAICRYLEELHPDPPLFGVDPLDRGKVEMCITEILAPDWPEFVWKSALRADSFLARLSDTDSNRGMVAPRAHVGEIAPNEAVTEEIDWFVFTKLTKRA